MGIENVNRANGTAESSDPASHGVMSSDSKCTIGEAL